VNARRALREQIYGVNSHLHVLHALEGLDPTTAGARPASAPHTIFQGLHHMVYWQDITLARLLGKNPARPASATLGWQTPAAPEDQSDWEAAVAGLAEGLRSLDSIVGDTNYDLGRVVDPERGRTAFEEILMALSHNSYHLGQIVLLRQELGAWPPPKGGDTW